ncbi:MAG: addiction module toxin, Txe/YoeB family [Ignavibacteria bacterium]|nr:addiction module toxin, Txe/YoeB family [Ignavibacteria bacterium]
MWKIVYTKQAQKDATKLASANLKEKAEKILSLLKDNPYQSPPLFEKLKGDLEGALSRRINFQHRIVYQIIKEEKLIKVLRMWTHYE